MREQLGTAEGQAFLSRRLDWPSVANSALARVVRGLFPSPSPGSLAAITAIEQAFAAESRARVPRHVYTLSVVWGQMVAETVLAWAATDGIAALNNCPYTPPVGPGLWQPTPPAFMPTPLQPCWGQLRPFVLTSSDECASPPHPPYSVDPNSAFHMNAWEVYHTNLQLTQEQKTIASYWADNAGATGTPAGHWIAIMGQLARQDDLSLIRATEGFARVGIAVADAFISCWETKYTYIPPTGHIDPGPHRSGLAAIHRHAKLSRIYLRPLRPVRRRVNGANRPVRREGVYGYHAHRSWLGANPRAAHVQLLRRGRRGSGAVPTVWWNPLPLR